MIIVNVIRLMKNLFIEEQASAVYDYSLLD